MVPNGLILTEQKLQEVVDYILTQDSFVFDIESSYDNRLDPNRNTVTWISIASHGITVVVPLGHPLGEENGSTTVPAVYGGEGPRAGKLYNKTVKLYNSPPVQLDTVTAFKILKPLFASDLVKGGHDVLFDLLSVSKYLGFVPPGPYFCTKVAFWLIDENRFTHGLKEMTELRYNFKYDFENVGKCVEEHPFSKVAYYSFCDSKFDFLHYLYLKDELIKQNLDSVFNLEMDVLNTLMGMRIAGIAVDIPALESLQKDLTLRLEQDKIKVLKAAGSKTFNINSTPQKQDALYLPPPVGQGLKPWKLTDGGKKAKKLGHTLTVRHYSTDDSVLESFTGNPLADAMRAYGDTDKVLNTYVNAYLGTEEKEARIVNGRLHTSFLQFGTVTGRLSSRAPNLQNIPRGKTELGRLLRSVFIADDGCKLICADYSQIELVVLAHYIGEGALFNGFLAGNDPHRQTAALVFGVALEDVTEEQRQAAKTLNFAIVYGAGANKVASMLGRQLKEAKKLLIRHEEMFPEIYDYKEAVINLARKRKPECYITTLMGRKRRVPLLLSRDDGIRMGAERQVFNSLIQGGAGDIMKKALVRIDSLLPDGAKLELTIHDEVVVSVPDNLVAEAELAVRKGMTGKGIQSYLTVPLKIEMHTGSRWSEIK